MTEYEIHDLAGIVAMASSLEQAALTDDIMRKGQKQPIVLYHNKIIDGRCRYLACQTLGIEPKVTHLDSSLTEEEVEEEVQSLNTRRNITETQKVMSALKQYHDKKLTPYIVAKKWGITESFLNRAIFIHKHRPDYVDPLFNGATIKLVNPETNATFETSTITTIQKNIKQWIEIEVEEIKQKDYGWNPDSAIDTEKGKAWFAKRIKAVPDVAKNMRDVISDYVELANFKFPK